MHTELVQLKQTNGLTREGLEFYRGYRKCEIAAGVVLWYLFGAIALLLSIGAIVSVPILIFYVYGIGIGAAVLMIGGHLLGYDPFPGFVNYDVQFLDQYREICGLFELNPQEFAALTDDERARRAVPIRKRLEGMRSHAMNQPRPEKIERSLKILDFATSTR